MARPRTELRVAETVVVLSPERDLMLTRVAAVRCLESVSHQSLRIATLAAVFLGRWRGSRQEHPLENACRDRSIDNPEHLRRPGVGGVGPSPTFAARVVAAAHRHAATPPPLPLPGKWLVLSLASTLVAVLGGVFLAGPELLQAVARDSAFTLLEAVVAGIDVVWVPAMALVTLAAVIGSVRLLREPV